MLHSPGTSDKFAVPLKEGIASLAQLVELLICNQ
jgi:hypothetical protein